ncbi:MAG: O-antigen ligase family protein [Deltaproteobacteria bacterium]|nr:O-antigen ligase family protein [Deltaproteobacteria bacterium]
MRLRVEQPGVRFMDSANYAMSLNPVNARERAKPSDFNQLITLRGLPGEFVLVLACIILDGGYTGDQAGLGIKIGPIPIFATDLILMAVIAISMRKRAGRLLDWGFTGGGAGAIGRAVWLLLLITLVHFTFAFPEYGLLAARDLAIFGYSLFFPLTYFALTQRVLAAKLIRYFVYVPCIAAVLVNLEIVSGIRWFALHQSVRGIPGHEQVARIGASNFANFGSVLAGLFAYLAVQREHRGLHAALILLCLATLAQIMDRSCILGFVMAGGVMFLLGAGRSRMYLSALGGGVFALLLLSAQGELPIPGGAKLHGLSQVLSSGANFESDPDAQFRLQRWHSAAQTWMTSPIFGVGFGVPIITADEWLRSEMKGAAQRGTLGAFNEGMPHNTFLTILARTGLIGFGLISYAWITVLVRLIKVIKRRATDPDQLAIVGILIAMIPVAALNLFFERPMLCVPFWIMLAAGYKLSEGVPREIAGLRARIAPGDITSRRPQGIGYPGPNRVARNYAASRHRSQD